MSRLVKMDDFVEIFSTTTGIRELQNNLPVSNLRGYIKNYYASYQIGVTSYRNLVVLQIPGYAQDVAILLNRIQYISRAKAKDNTVSPVRLLDDYLSYGIKNTMLPFAVIGFENDKSVFIIEKNSKNLVALISRRMVKLNKKNSHFNDVKPLFKDFAIKNNMTLYEMNGPAIKFIGRFNDTSPFWRLTKKSLESQKADSVESYNRQRLGTNAFREYERGIYSSLTTSYTGI